MIGRRGFLKILGVAPIAAVAGTLGCAPRIRNPFHRAPSPLPHGPHGDSVCVDPRCNCYLEQLKNLTFKDGCYVKIDPARPSSLRTPYLPYGRVP